MSTYVMESLANNRGYGLPVPAIPPILGIHDRAIDFIPEQRAASDSFDILRPEAEEEATPSLIDECRAVMAAIDKVMARASRELQADTTEAGDAKSIEMTESEAALQALSELAGKFHASAAHAAEISDALFQQQVESVTPELVGAGSSR